MNCPCDKKGDHLHSVSSPRLKDLRKFICQEIANNSNRKEYPDSLSLDVLPIMHNKGFFIMQFRGWSVTLYEDGRWIVEDTYG